MHFREKWFEAVERKGSVLCAGLDPAEFEMGRGEKGLPKGVHKLNWALGYVEAVAPFCVAVKPNTQYWKGEFDAVNLREITEYARNLGLLIIEDSKLADIGSTNDVGIFHASQRADAVTIAPYAGNMEEVAELCRKHGIGAITMCLMSNPEYDMEKNMFVETGVFDLYDSADVLEINGLPHTRRYMQLAHDANKFGLGGIVVGAPSPKNHITDEELAKVRKCVDDRMVVLSPGIGAQGGNAEVLWRYFGGNNVIANVGRAMMFPKGSNSHPQDQAEIAEAYRDILNKLRLSA